MLVSSVNYNFVASEPPEQEQALFWAQLIIISDCTDSFTSSVLSVNKNLCIKKGVPWAGRLLLIHRW